MMVGAILNTILDPLLIFVFHWGVEGAALATILSQFIGLLFNIAYLFKFKTIRFTRSSLVMKWSISGRLASLGFASCFNNLTSTVVAFVSNNLLTQYGALSEYGADIPLTTFGLCMKVSMIAFSIGIGVANGSQPIIGFNFGAEKYDRVKKDFPAGVLCLHHHNSTFLDHLPVLPPAANKDIRYRISFARSLRCQMLPPLSASDIPQRTADVHRRVLPGYRPACQSCDRFPFKAAHILHPGNACPCSDLRA